MSSQYYVYIMTNKANFVLYIGVTNDLIRRVGEHQLSADPASFTAKYHLGKLVYYEICEDARAAISREKQLKAGSREKKLKLISGMNPAWKDLSKEIFT